MSDYCPGAVQVPQPGGGGLDSSLPARAIWHITWDALKPDGTQPQFSAVANYLKNQGYCPHLMWNPFTGYIEQYYPASQSARALAAWNGDGAACVQIEVFFTPGCVVDGVKYQTVAETPLQGFDTIMSWLDGFGIPRAWPLGSPQWQGNSRDADTWNAQGGHYGHCNVPDNTHTDPGPMPDLNRGAGTISVQGTTTTTEEDDMFTDADRALLQATLNKADGGQLRADLAYQNDTLFSKADGAWQNGILADISSKLGNTLNKADGGYIVGLLNALKPGATDPSAIADAVVTAVGKDIAAEVVTALGQKLGAAS